MPEGDASRWTAEGNRLSGQGRYEEALAALDQAIGIEPEIDYHAWMGKSAILRHLRRHWGSTVAYVRAARIGWPLELQRLRAGNPSLLQRVPARR